MANKMDKMDIRHKVEHKDGQVDGIYADLADVSALLAAMCMEEMSHGHTEPYALGMIEGLKVATSVLVTLGLDAMGLDVNGQPIVTEEEFNVMFGVH